MKHFIPWLADNLIILKPTGTKQLIYDGVIARFLFCLFPVGPLLCFISVSIGDAVVFKKVGELNTWLIMRLCLKKKSVPAVSCQTVGEGNVIKYFWLKLPVMFFPGASSRARYKPMFSLIWSWCALRLIDGNVLPNLSLHDRAKLYSLSQLRYSGSIIYAQMAANTWL